MGLRIRIGALCCICLMAGLTPRALGVIVGTARYEVIDIGVTTGLNYSAGISISNTGYVAGERSNGINFQQAFNWSLGTGFRSMSSPPSGNGQSFPGKINNAGQMTGVSFGSPTRGVLWNADASVAFVFQSADIDQPTGLNNLGAVTGYRNALGSQSAYVWSGGSYTDLGFPSPAISSQGFDINDAGQVAGTLGGAFASGPAAFRWSPGSGFTTFATSNTFSNIDVRDLSNPGVIVGTGYLNGSGNRVAWRWNSLTGFSTLSTLPGAPPTEAWAINDGGTIVGWSGNFGTLWDQGILYRANDLLAPGYTNWNITTLRGVNNDGWLTGEALPPGSPFSHAVLLRPIPEPAFTAMSVLLLLPLSRAALPRRRPL